MPDSWDGVGGILSTGDLECRKLLATLLNQGLGWCPTHPALIMLLEPAVKGFLFEVLKMTGDSLMAAISLSLSRLLISIPKVKVGNFGSKGS